MQPPARPPLIDVLDPAVLAFQSEDNNFILRDDLDHLDRVRNVGAPEAVVLYGTRILESMTRHLLRPHQRPSDHVAENLNLLRHYFNLPLPLKRWLDCLRGLGNDARHVERRLTDNDADMAFVIVLRWLNWYFCEYAWGAFRSGLLVANQPLASLLPGDLARLIDQLDRLEVSNADFLAALRLDDRDSLVLLTPVVPAVVAEILLGRKRLPEAYTLLQAARKCFSRDLRLRQLEALYWSRRGEQESAVQHLHRARRELEGLRPTDSAADEETHGILAGIYKRLSELDAKDPSWLRRCHQEYRGGWERSQRTNNYLGINAAATALWLGEELDATRLAAQVRQTLEGLREGLQKAVGGPRPLTYWDQVTLAEACMLQGDLDQARELYREAFGRFSQNTAEIDVTRKQALRILEQMGLAERGTDIVGPTNS